MTHRAVDDFKDWRDWAHDHELLHARDKEERRRERSDLIDAVKKHVDTALVPLRDVPAKIDRVLATNDTQLEMMKETERYRGQREEQERAAKQKKSDDELALAKAKLDAEEKARSDAKEIERQKQRTQRWQIAAGVITAVVVALIGVLAAVHK